jgi:hypothetical protein
MFRTVFLSLLGLGVVAILPAAYYQAKDYWKGLAVPGVSASTAAPSSPPAANADPGPADPAARAVAPLPAVAPLEGNPIHALTEVLRFDVSPGWIIHRWPRVSSGLGDLQLQGYRVPLVTGTAESDLAGALTYYFNPQQQVQRITFRGTTGDMRNVVAVAASQFHMTRRLTNDPSLIVYEAVHSSNDPASALRIRSAAVLRASEPYKRFDVELVLQRPEE